MVSYFLVLLRKKNYLAGASYNQQVNPETTKTDWHLVSPNSITAESNLKVMRMEEMSLLIAR